MHTYKHSRSEAVWTVGYHAPRSDVAGIHYQWVALRDFNTEEGAAAYASYLNGGSKP